MEKAITFRPTEETAAILQRKKDEGCNISAWINQALMLTESKRVTNNYSTWLRIIPCSNWYLNNPTDIAALGAIPVGRLNIKQYKEYLNILQNEGLELFRFRIDENLTMSIASINREEASLEFDKYFTRPSEKEPYVRTSLPLPAIYYDRTHKSVLIKYYEPIQTNSD
jgi:hypothetical protein